MHMTPSTAVAKPSKVHIPNADSIAPKDGKKPQEATVLLRADHAVMAALFEDYDASRSRNRKNEIVAQICTALSIHGV